MAKCTMALGLRHPSLGIMALLEAACKAYRQLATGTKTRACDRVSDDPTRAAQHTLHD